MPKPKKEGGNTFGRLSSTFKRIDLFGETVEFQIDGKASYGSLMGAVLSILVLVVTLSYAFKRFNVMTTFGDTFHQITQQPVDFSKDDPLIWADTGMVFNFALKTAADYNTHFVDTHGYIEYNLINMGF